VGGALDDQAYADGRCEVVDDVALVNHLVHRRVVHDRVDHEVEPRMAPQVLHVRELPGGQIVDHIYVVSVLQQRVDQVRADKPRAAGYENLRHSEPLSRFLPLVQG
jgi:hypothetical protein